MKKIFLPCSSASVGGEKIDIENDHSAMVTEKQFAKLIPHGAKPWTSEIAVEQTMKYKVDPEMMDRRQLISLVNGFVPGSIATMKTSELVKEAKKILASKGMKFSDGEDESPEPEPVTESEPEAEPEDDGSAVLDEAETEVDGKSIQAPVPIKRGRKPAAPTE